MKRLVLFLGNLIQPELLFWVFIRQDNIKLFLLIPPGWQKPVRALDRYMNKFIDWSIEQVDCILMISDARFWKNEDKMIVESISCASKPKVLIINKVDLVRDKV